MDPARLKLAAFLGDEAARRATDQRPLDRRDFRDVAIDAWARSLAYLSDRETMVRAAYVVARRRADLHREVVGRDRLYELLVEAVRGAILAPGRETRARAGTLASDLGRLHGLRRNDFDWWTCAILGLVGHAAATEYRGPAACSAAKAIRWADHVPAFVPQRAAKRASLGRGRVRHAIRRELVPWLLGEDDPLRV